LGKPHHIRRLLPVLEDESPGWNETEPICDRAAETIAHIAAKLDPSNPDQRETQRLARAGLEKMLRGPRGATALNYLVWNERDEDLQAEMAVSAACDQSLPFATRVAALRKSLPHDRATLGRLLPLLDDKTRGDEHGLSLAEHAANTIAELLDKSESIGDDTPQAKRAEFVGKVRTWAKNEWER